MVVAHRSDSYPLLMNDRVEPALVLPLCAWVARSRRGCCPLLVRPTAHVELHATSKEDTKIMSTATKNQKLQ